MNQTFKSFYAGKRVLLTGHTGFKGSWLAEWLLDLGAEVTGLALEPDTDPALCQQLRLPERLSHRIGDIRDAGLVREVVGETQPDVILHLAAQPLVRLSYQTPLETYATNVMGTAHVLDAARQLKQPCALLCVTTDKCYENREWVHSYREEDPMGGYDPYSSSKGCAELLINSYRRSFFSHDDSPVGVASARAGNVLGGGDWALDRIIPDCMRALSQGQAIPVRNKHATRPWQHVLEPLGGYLLLAMRLHEAVLGRLDGSLTERQATAFGAYNFGPSLEANRPVGQLVEEVLKHWPGEWLDQSDHTAPHEASLLNLATDKAFHFLDWQPRWDFALTIAHTVQWYRAVLEDGADPVELTQKHIADYVS